MFGNFAKIGRAAGASMLSQAPVCYYAQDLFKTLMFTSHYLNVLKVINQI